MKQERKRRRWCKANPRWWKCVRCGGDRMVGLQCPACMKAYAHQPHRIVARRVAVKKYTDRGAREMHRWYMRIVLRDRPGLPPELVELAKRNLKLKRAAGLTNIGNKGKR